MKKPTASSIALPQSVVGILCAALILPAALSAADGDGDIPRTASGRPDLTGVYDIATLTPLERDPKFGENLYLSPEEAEEIARTVADRRAADLEASDPTREAPPPGGDGVPRAPRAMSAAYNDFWLDYGSRSISIDGQVPHVPRLRSIRPTAALPEMTPAAQRKRMAFFTLFRENTGTAWWLERTTVRDRTTTWSSVPLGERCILGFGSTSGPPDVAAPPTTI